MSKMDHQNKLLALAFFNLLLNLYFKRFFLPMLDWM